MSIKNAILIILLMSLIAVASADNSSSSTHITYMSFIDPELGFYKVIDETTHQPSDYVDHILTINQGDTIIWKNDADSPNVVMTVISEQNLFPDAALPSNTAVFPYVFQQGGKFTFHLGEHTTSTLTIMVRATNTPIPAVITPIPTTATPTPTPIPTENTPVNTPTVTLPTPSAMPTPMATDTPVATPIADNNADNNNSMSLTQITSIIVVILSVYITYRTGKDKE